MTVRQKMSTWAVVATALVLGVLPAGAGTSTTPDLTDIAGDANGVNSQGRAAVDGRDTRPASVDSADLRAVWFETTYQKEKVVDPASGAVTKVKHVPTGLNVHVQTTAPVYPASIEGMRPLNYDVLATLPGSCSVRFRGLVGGNAANDTAVLHTLSQTCSSGISTNSDVTKPTYNGNVMSFSYPYYSPQFADLLRSGATITPTSAVVLRPVPFAGAVQIDEALTSPAPFTIGQDVPADIDCTATPTNPECAQ